MKARITYHTMNTQQRIDKLTEELRDIYKTSDGPRLIHEAMEEFPYPRRLWNEPSGSAIPGGWGLLATTSVPR